MTYSKKRTLSYGVILISVLLAYFCRQVRTENVFMRNLADQCRSCIYLGMYCAWVIYLGKHVVHKKTRRCLTAIGCLMVFWFFVRTVKFHIFHDPLGEHICWYLYYIPMLLIPVLGLAAAMFLGEKEEEKTVRKVIILLTVAAILIVSVFTNDLHQLVFRFSKQPPFSDEDYSYGIVFMVIQGWILICLTGMEIILIRKSRIPGKKQFWLPVIPGILLLGWNIGNILRLPFIKIIAGDMTAVCCLLMAAIFQGCILCGLIQTNNRYFELFQTSGGLDAEITDHSFQRYYHSGDFPELSPELRKIIIDRSSVQEQGIRINHIPIRGGHLFWSEDISVLLDQYQDIREQQEELTARNRLLQKAYQKEAERRKTEEQDIVIVMSGEKPSAGGQVFQIAEEMPSFPGGIDECMRYIARHVKYPAISIENGAQGIVSVRFIIEKDGSISNPKIAQGVDEYLDKEAMRVIMSMPKWKPGKQRGVAVRTQFTLPVKFRLVVDEAKKDNTPLQNRKK